MEQWPTFNLNYQVRFKPATSEAMKMAIEAGFRYLNDGVFQGQGYEVMRTFAPFMDVGGGNLIELGIQLEPVGVSK